MLWYKKMEVKTPLQLLNKLNENYNKNLDKLHLV